MADAVKDLRRLVIKAYHINEVEWGEHNKVTADGKMIVSKEMLDKLVKSEPLIEKIDLQIAYNDTTFTDGRSKVSFADFLVKSISY